MESKKPIIERALLRATEASAGEVECESCGVSFRGPEEDHRCGGCGKVVCPACVQHFDHWKGGLHGVGDPAVDANALREALATARKALECVPEERARWAWETAGEPDDPRREEAICVLECIVGNLHGWRGGDDA